MPKQIIILGGGLAGSFMAARLCKAGQAVTLIDDPQPNSASHVAAGLFNVITGRYGAKSWMADTLLQEIANFFSIPEFQILKQYIHYSPIYRAFKEEGEYNKWLGKSADPAFSHLVELQEKALCEEQVINPHGGIMILPCGWVDISALLAHLHQILVDRWQMNLCTERLAYDQIDLTQQKIQLPDEEQFFDHLVLATGQYLDHCPWLPTGSIIPNKGEILVIESEELDLPFVLSKKIYLIPLGNHRFLTGSTYANTFDDDQPSDAAKEEMLTYLRKAIHLPFKVVDHWAGIRPTTKNRRPIVGTHPAYPQLHVLGGFGTKGVLLAPYGSRLLTEQIMGASVEIPHEANLLRLY